jgi:hypothetical protein
MDIKYLLLLLLLGCMVYAITYFMTPPFSSGSSHVSFPTEVIIESF